MGYFVLILLRDSEIWLDYFFLHDNSRRIIYEFGS